MPPEWIDYNGHMMDAYYFLAFTEATEAFLDHVAWAPPIRRGQGAASTPQKATCASSAA